MICGLAVRGRDFLFYAAVWALAMLALGFGEEFLFRGYALKALAEGIGFTAGRGYSLLDLRVGSPYLQTA